MSVWGTAAPRLHPSPTLAPQAPPLPAPALLGQVWPHSAHRPFLDGRGDYILLSAQDSPGNGESRPVSTSCSPGPDAPGLQGVTPPPGHLSGDKVKGFPFRVSFT